MERCARCQAEVALLAAAADRLLDLVPARGAPDGFESHGPQLSASRCRDKPPGATEERQHAASWRGGDGGTDSRRRRSGCCGRAGLGFHQIGARPQALWSVYLDRGPSDILGRRR
jgi:hypothetical protein